MDDRASTADPVHVPRGFLSRAGNGDAEVPALEVAFADPLPADERPSAGIDRGPGATGLPPLQP